MNLKSSSSSNDMTDQQKQQFLSMACELSPENLYCDGEISSAQAQRKYQDIMKRWHKLESEVGRTVSEQEIWDWNWNRKVKIS